MAKRDINNPVVLKIKDITKKIYGAILLQKQPQMEMPIRSLSNVTYSDKEGYFELLDKTKTRTLTASTIKTFAQTLQMIRFSKNLF